MVSSKFGNKETTTQSERKQLSAGICALVFHEVYKRQDEDVDRKMIGTDNEH